jgi:hypothetical protein
MVLSAPTSRGAPPGGAALSTAGWIAGLAARGAAQFRGLMFSNRCGVCISAIKRAARIGPMQGIWRSKRQLWTYSGLGIETHNSAQFRFVSGQLQRSKKPQQLQSRARSSVPPVLARTSAHAHWLPSPRAPSFPGPRDRGRTSPLPRDVTSVALRNLQFPYPHTQFAGSPGDDRILIMIMSAPFYPSLFGWSAPPSLLGHGSRRCYGIIYTSNSQLVKPAAYEQLRA